MDNGLDVEKSSRDSAKEVAAETSPRHRLWLNRGRAVGAKRLATWLPLKRYRVGAKKLLRALDNQVRVGMGLRGLEHFQEQRSGAPPRMVRFELGALAFPSDGLRPWLRKRLRALCGHVFVSLQRRLVRGLQSLLQQRHSERDGHDFFEAILAGGVDLFEPTIWAE